MNIKCNMNIIIIIGKVSNIKLMVIIDPTNVNIINKNVAVISNIKQPIYILILLSFSYIIFYSIFTTLIIRVYSINKRK